MSSYCVVCRTATGGTKLCPEHRACSPAEQLRVHLGRARAADMAFDHAWGQALQRIAWPHDTSHRREWKSILGDGKDMSTPKKMLASWRRAYEGEPSRLSESAPGLLAAA